MKNLITQYKSLPIEVKKAMKYDFPFGIEEELQSIKNVITGTYFEGVIYKYGDTSYLIKMNADTPIIKFEEEFERDKDEQSFDLEEAFEEDE